MNLRVWQQHTTQCMSIFASKYLASHVSSWEQVEALGERAGEAVVGAGGDTGPRFDFGLGEAAGERGGADVEDDAGAPKRISLM